ncbi:glycerol kinase [Leptospira perolatii]|uniref:Glycerol kinase 5 n=1 Tax=Leptospira perolatii TaxID=2023191 RepID=A0A2M9ZKA3_9LEPT|nr:FGGY family carbohydrate kinase [Leptospira perolatii]PJZ69333.1 glycerol kinase [Leptospira perolatii]PJZ72468.1 glycerol kinase [Leptospira perolatii]
MAQSKDKYVLSIDSGGSGIRAILFDKKGSIVERQYEKTPPITKEPGSLEHDPEVLWKALLSIVKKIIKKKQFHPSNFAGIGICNQRGSFLLWEKETGKPLTKLISWADVRSGDTADQMNSHKLWRFIQIISGAIGKLTGHPMMIATYMLRFTTDHASVRLKWVFDRNPELRKRAQKGEILFGTLDTWFVYKLTGGKEHLSDPSNATVTGMFNPFQLQWNGPLCGIFKIPMKIFPKVRDTGSDFGVTDPKLFNGISIPIRAVVGDQMAALYGHCCFERGGVKISQGSGAFVDMNMGNKPKLSKKGLFPLVAWQLGGVPTYMLEGYVATAGTLIDWLGKGIGLSDTPKVLNELAAQTQDTEGVIFVPTASGMRYPHFNPRAKASIFGLSLATHRRHVARAVLEGIALSLYEILEGIKQDTKVPVTEIMVDGGVSQSDILLQCLSDFCNVEVKRAPEPDMTATGAAYLAGLACGFWKNQEELKSIQKGYKVFRPKMDPRTRDSKLSRWKKAVKGTLEMD